MSNPMTADKIISQLKRWNAPTMEYRNWRTHNRNHKGLFDDVRGLIIHHTGSDGSDQRELLYSGRSDLPGPLCHFGIDQKGTIYLVGWGRANHAGLGDGNILQLVTSENYSDNTKLTPHVQDTDGNRYFYGVEIWYNGNHSMTTAQYSSLMLLCGAVAEHHKWTDKSFIGHGEWSTEKWDPGISKNKMMNMSNVRLDIRDTIKRGPVVIDQPDTKDAVYKSVWNTDAAKPPKGHATEDNPTWEMESLIRFAAENAEAANKKIDELLRILKNG